MAMNYTVLIHPNDTEAKEWYERYRRYRALKGSAASWYARRYEPDMWFMAFFTLLVVCSARFYISWWLLLHVVSVGGYWGWALDRTPRLQRKYQRLVRDRRILLVPKFLASAVDSEAQKLGIRDWDVYPTRRFQLLGETLLEAGPWLAELGNDCGCQKECGHTNRLSRRIRESLRARVRTAAGRKVAKAAQDHAAAIEMNKHRQRHIRGALRATPEEDD